MIRGAPTFYWINLDRAKDRRERLMAEFEHHGVANVRVPAVDGRTLAFTREKGGETTCEHGTFHSSKPGDVTKACTLSHLKAVQLFYKSGDAVAIICEDDLTFEYLPKWKKPLADVLVSAPTDCDVLQLAITLSLGPFMDHAISSSHSNYEMLLSKDEYVTRPGFVFKGTRYWGAVAYSITRAGAQKLLKAHGWNGEKFDIRVTDYEADMEGVYHRNLVTYTYYRPLFTYPMDNDSSVHSTHLPLHSISKMHVDSMLDGVARPAFLTVVFDTMQWCGVELVAPISVLFVARHGVEHFFGLDIALIAPMLTPDLQNWYAELWITMQRFSCCCSLLCVRAAMLPLSSTHVCLSTRAKCLESRRASLL
eukprot:SAG31_NODE_4724_length_3006_cov_1.802202_2_plen_365_part_00